jgi:hypothetical protein
LIIYQRPNFLLLAAIILSLIGHFTGGMLHSVSHALGVIVWIAWGYDELRYGASWFRRGLGIFVLGGQFAALLKQ